MNPEIESMARAAVAALFNGVYQGLVLAGVLWLGWKLFRGSNAATRHAVTLVALFVIALLPLLHLVASIGGGRGGDGTVALLLPSRKANTVTPAGGAAGRPKSPTPSVASGAELFAEVASDGSPEQPIHSPAGFESAEHPVYPFYVRQVPLASAEHGASAARGADADALNREGDAAFVPASGIVVESSVDAFSPFRRPLVRYWQASLPSLLSLSIIGLIVLVGGVRLLRLGMQSVTLVRLKRNGIPASGEVARLFSCLLAESPITRSVQLVVSEEVSAPMAIGYLNAVVLLPRDLLGVAAPHELRSVLCHELAHIQRRDDWCNLIQQVVAATCFFNPAVWWLSRRLTTDREIACDDQVLTTSRSPQDYALLLTEFAGRSRGCDWTAAPAAWSSRSQLKERIQMILDPKRNRSSRLARTSVGALTLITLATAAAAWLAGPRLVLAAAADPPVEPSSSNAASDSVEDTLRYRTGRQTAQASAGGAATVSPAEPEELRSLKTPKAPKAPRAPVPTQSTGARWKPVQPDSDRQSLERRLERLERRLEELASEKELGFEPAAEGIDADIFAWGDNPEPGEGSDELEIHRESLSFEFDHPEWAMNEAQQQAVERAVKAAEAQIARAMQQYGPADHDLPNLALLEADISRQMSSQHANRLGQQLRQLEEQRRALGRQMQSLDRQMAALYEQKALLDERVVQGMDLPEVRR